MNHKGIAALSSVAATAVLAGCLVTGAFSNTTAGQFLFQNKWNFPDPSVAKYDGTYYGFATGAYIQTGSSSSLTTGWTLSSQAITDPPNWANNEFWGPSSHRVWASIPGVGSFWVYYLYFSATESVGANHSIGVALATSPTGPYLKQDDAKLVAATSNGRGAIDPKLFVDDDGQRYLLYSRDHQDRVRCQGAKRTIVVRKMTDAGHASTQAAVILTARGYPDSSPNHWEKCTVEAPTMMKTEGRYLLLYSGGNFEDGSYGIGLADCGEDIFGGCTRIVNTSNDPGDQWPKFSGWHGTVSPGGADLLQDGIQKRLVFHHTTNASPLRRRMATVPLTVNINSGWEYE